MSEIFVASGWCLDWQLFASIVIVKATFTAVVCRDSIIASATLWFCFAPWSMATSQFFADHQFSMPSFPLTHSILIPDNPVPTNLYFAFDVRHVL